GEDSRQTERKQKNGFHEDDCALHCMTSDKYVRSMEFNILAVKHSLIRDIPCLQRESARPLPS
ncbi:MAG: hypothetical protein ACREXO_02690, partial [Advenella sp.]